ncbi:hypothetical protein HDU98_005681 [Podochytrium sp. JEL0797]|nr:hypothetical protein HDU98_005681 [Podochytrium sp. JEL0797]
MLGFVVLATTALALNNGVGRTPAMGWNSWNKFGCNVNEELIREHADAVVSTGLATLGYNHINIDDCWAQERDKDGFIHEDPKSFPSGMRALADYIHSKGLKFGLYSSAGTLTCAKRPGGLHYETQDAQTYAHWGIDYFKYDNCNNQAMNDIPGTIRRYGDLRDALNATGRPINYALCSWGENSVWEFGDSLGNSWRTTGDISDNWESVSDLINRNVFLSKWAHPGGFNDLDMLEVGNGGMSDTEYRTHFSVWAALKSPLLLGHDVRAMTPETLAIIGNPEVIAINQDSLGKAAYLRAIVADVWTWVGELEGGDRVLVVVNKGDKGVRGVNVGVGVFATEETLAASGGWVLGVRDLEARVDVGVVSGSVGLVLGFLPPHGSRILRISHRNGEFPALVEPHLVNASVSLVAEPIGFLPLFVVFAFLVGIVWVRSRRNGYIELK